MNLKIRIIIFTSLFWLNTDLMNLIHDKFEFFEKIKYVMIGIMTNFQIYKVKHFEMKRVLIVFKYDKSFLII